MRNSFLRKPALVCALVCAAGVVRADGGARIEGVVRDAHGAAVVAAGVTLRSAQQAVVATTQTDAQGRFKFEDVARGSYLLVVTAPGLAERRVAVQAGEGAVGGGD